MLASEAHEPELSNVAGSILEHGAEYKLETTSGWVPD